MLGDYDSGEDVDIQDIQPQPFPDPSSSSNAAERFVRKRSSKACDNCRKAKCKCERTAANEPCKNCVVNGQECTFLGPSRKRGPPKGYIDALESKLHQMEALLGSILASPDPRARTLIFDLAQNELAREILNRVDESPFGRKGRDRRNPAMPSGHGRRRDGSRNTLQVVANNTEGGGALGYSPYEWQDSLVALIGGRPHERHGHDLGTMDPLGGVSHPQPPFKFETPTEYSFNESNPYQRRRHLAPLHSSPSTRHQSLDGLVTSISNTSPEGLIGREDEDEDSDLADELGQLSINELKQVRYHGKASGLHLLMPAMEDVGNSNEEDESTEEERSESSGLRISRSPAGPGEERTGRGRVKKGIWKFPAAGVWPPAPPPSRSTTTTDDSPKEVPVLPKRLSDRNLDTTASPHLPCRERQEEYVALYFAYVHPLLPVVQKRQFLRDFASRANESNPEYKEAIERVSNLLLFAIFSIVARYSDEDALPDGETMWTAGDVYLERAQELIIMTESSSTIDNVQCLLLLGYRDIGLGKMERAWLHIGMAVRVAQDLGLHRSMAKWAAAGRLKFSDVERETRSRVWHACMRMDKYVSTYIGRPVMVSEQDYDTPLPEEDEEEENELWMHPLRSIPAGAEDKGECLSRPGHYVPQPSKVIACFNEAITVSKYLGMIVSNFYSVRPPPSAVRREARHLIEQKLEKWHNDLPEHLRYVPHGGKIPTPHVIVLHMQYWGAVLLLHRPLLQAPRRQPGSPRSTGSSNSEDEIARALGICQTAAHHITNLGTTFSENFCPRRAPAMLSYYVFSASIMHVSSLMDDPTDVQARVGLQKAKSVLKSISVVWPSALRAWDLLDGVKADIGKLDPTMLNNVQDRPTKRLLVDTDAPNLPPAFRTGPISANPASNSRDSRSPSATRNRSVDGRGRFGSQQSRTQPLQLSQPAMSLTSGSIPSISGHRHSQIQLTEPKTPHSGQSIHTPFQASAPLHSAGQWGLSDHDQAYHYSSSSSSSPTRRDSQLAHLSNGLGDLHGRSSIVVPQHIPFEPQFGGSEYQRQSTMDAYFSGISTSARQSPSVQQHPLATPTFRETFQQPSVTDTQHYVPPRPDPWQQHFSQTNSYSDSSMLPSQYDPLSLSSVTAPTSGLVPDTTSMLPPLMIPNDTYTRPMQSQQHATPNSGLATDPVPSHGYSLDPYFGDAGGNAASYLRAASHRQNGL